MSGLDDLFKDNCPDCKYSKQQIKDLMLEVIGEDQALKWHIGDCTYGDTSYDAASADYGRYDLQQELRQKVNKL